jgi:multiphosphoryl transfer protein
VVGIVVVSHSERLAEGVVTLAREMGGEELALEPAGGIEEPDVLGTDAGRIHAAIERAMSEDGVLVLMDLGSALMSAELAVELVGQAQGPIRLSEGPLVEGTVAAAVAASGGASLDEVAAQARDALAMKAGQLGSSAPATPTPDELSSSAPSGEPAGRPAPDARNELLVRNQIGLHARPAARLIALARGFDAEVQIARVGGGEPARATSLTAVVALGARLGDTLEVTATGPQAQAAVDALRELAEQGFGDGVVSSRAGSDEAARSEAGAESAPSEAEAARSEADAARWEADAEPDPRDLGSPLVGVAVSPGVAIGPARWLRGADEAPPDRTAQEPAQERSLLERGREEAREAIEHDRALVAQRAGEAESEIFDAHLALLDDDALTEAAGAAIDAGASAEHAWHDAARQVADRYRALSEPVLRERATDVQDVGRRVVDALTRGGVQDASNEGIVIATELTPTDVARLDPELVTGIATARGSATAHAAILARALGLPTVVGLGSGLRKIEEGTPLLLDGDAATLEVDPPAQELEEARVRRERALARRAAARETAHEPALTRDGERVEVFANLGGAAQAGHAVELGAEGVGLLRTEFLFLDRVRLPDEEEQTETLRQIAAALDGRPLIVRTLDAGADKPMAALPMPPEDNPFLGIRGIRLTLRRPDVMATQFRAILRVAADYPLKAMLPMVATLEEVLAARRLLDRARDQTGVDAQLELGIMVEVPAAALSAGRLAAHVDFFSLGTNDLTQYTMAAERGDARLASLLAGPQPAVLELVRATVQAAATHGRPVGVCGELAGDPAAAVLLAGLGVTELSMTPELIPEVKAALRQVELAEARRAALAAIDTDSAQEARALGLALL